MMFIVLLIILALAMLAKTVSPYVSFRPENMYTRPIKDWMAGIDPGLSGRVCDR